MGSLEQSGRRECGGVAWKGGPRDAQVVASGWGRNAFARRLCQQEGAARSGQWVGLLRREDKYSMCHVHVDEGGRLFVW